MGQKGKDKMIKEIIRPVSTDDRKEGELCPYCNISTKYQEIKCPEGMAGCLVIHYGWHCDKCGRDFN